MHYSPRSHPSVAERTGAAQRVWALAHWGAARRPFDKSLSFLHFTHERGSTPIRLPLKVTVTLSYGLSLLSSHTSPGALAAHRGGRDGPRGGGGGPRAPRPPREDPAPRLGARMGRPERVVSCSSRADCCAAAIAAAAVCSSLSRSAATSTGVRERWHMCSIHNCIAAPALSHVELSRGFRGC